MYAITNIRTRRSIRKYAERAVEKEAVQEIVADAAYAPSWMNSQTAGYIAVLDKETKDNIAENMIAQNDIENVKNAPAVVLLTSKNNVSGFMPDGRELIPGMSVHWQSFDAGIAAQTFCLAAHAHGLGTLIMGVWDEEKVKQIADVSTDCRIAAIIALGYADNEPKTPKRKSVEELLKII